MKFHHLPLFLFSVGCFQALGQDDIDTTVKSSYQLKVEHMVDSLNMSDSVEIHFYEIYNEYGQRMKEAYENRTSLLKLNHVYQWSVRDRDSKMKAILTPAQLHYFKKRQSEIERESRTESKKED